MRYSTNDGGTVEALRAEGGATEFVTRNSDGETVSTVRVASPMADALVAKLEGGDSR